jgi:hypothetical protein
LTNTYQNKLLSKIKDNFNDTEQQLFISSFYCYLNYNKTDFIIDLDTIWSWLGFSTKQKTKDLLEKNFKQDIDYKCLLNQQGKQTNVGRGGHNKEKIMLNIKTFKLLCLKAGTKKAGQIHEYYLKLEETLQEVIEEESNELKLQLEAKDIQLKTQEETINNNELSKINLREKTILEQFPINTQCIYYGMIDNVGNNGEKLVKFGNSNNLKNRVYTHKHTYTNFRLINAFKVDNKLQIETAIKENNKLSEKRREIIIKYKKYNELLSIENMSFNDLDKIIKDTIKGIEFSPENYLKILEENKQLKQEIYDNKEKNNTINLFVANEENIKLKKGNTFILKKYKSVLKKYKCNDIDIENVLEVNEIVTDINALYNNTINYMKQTNFLRDKDGLYHINGNSYDLLNGTREEVWENKAYRTTGHLTKNDLLVNKNNKIVSKKKCEQEKDFKRFLKCGINKIID